MNKEKIIDLIKKSKKNEIVLICGKFINYKDKNGNEVEIEIPAHERQQVWDCVHDEMVFVFIDNNMQTLVKLK